MKLAGLKGRVRNVPRGLILFLCLALGTLMFLKFSSEVTEGDTMALDGAFLRSLRHATEGTTPLLNGLRGAMLDLTALGDNATLTLVTVLVAGYLVCARRKWWASYLIGAVAGGAVLVTLLKFLFARARPEVVPHLVPIATASFPSGHAMNSAIVYLTLAALLMRGSSSVLVRRYVLSVGILLTLGVGFSRLYLGVHWPTDVVAGWVVGATWATVCSMLAQRVEGANRRLITEAN